MDLETAKSLTLEKLTDAIGQVQTALIENSIVSANRAALEHTLVALRDIQNKIIVQSEQDLIDALKGVGDNLDQLADQINEAAEKLDKITATIKTVSSTVGILINVAAAAASGGII
jgi:hypothetical protein